MQAVILTHRRVGGVPLALRPVCGVALIRRQLQGLRMNEWRDAILIVCPQDRQRIASAIGVLSLLGMQVSYLTTPRETDLPLKACLEATGGDLLIIEAHYVIEGSLLERLVTSGPIALLSEAKSDDLLPEEGYAGAVFLTRSDLEKLAAESVALPWPAGLMRMPLVEEVEVRQSDLYVAEVWRHVEPF